MKALVGGRDSECFPAPPEGERLVVREVGFGSPPELHRSWLKTFRTLTPPFQRVLDVEFDGNTVEVLLERFIGVDGMQLLHSLEATGRVLPIDVGLALAQAWGEALLQVPVSSDGWKTPVNLGQLGIDVRGELVLTFDTPNFVIGRSWTNPEAATRTGGLWNVPESIAPEFARGLPIDETARVYSLAVSLLALLEGRRMFDKHESIISMIADIALKGLSWGSPRNPALSPELEQVLRRATALEPTQRFATIPEFLNALTTAARQEPATPRHMMDVLLGVSPRMLSCLEKLEPEALPTSWREGGLQVLNDRLLERLVPITSLPEART